MKCIYCNQEAKPCSNFCDEHWIKGIDECHAPPASDDGKRSSGIGEPLPPGQAFMAYATQLLNSSDNKTEQAIKGLTEKIQEQDQTIRFLAEQVKTLVDALAEDQDDPDQPISSYLSGKPV